MYYAVVGHETCKLVDSYRGFHRAYYVSFHFQIKMTHSTETLQTFYEVSPCHFSRARHFFYFQQSKLKSVQSAQIRN
jgi:hypothetical protein